MYNFYPIISIYKNLILFINNQVKIGKTNSEQTELIFNHKTIETDSEGYLKNLSDWNEALANQIADNEKIALTQEHWEVITFVRDFYLEYNYSPAMRPLVKAMEKSFGQEKANSRYLYRLFPLGPAKQATKIAGLPKPVNCI